MSNPYFQKALEQFNEKALRPALAAAQDKLDQKLASVPPSLIVRAVEDAYAQMNNVDVAGSLGAIDTTAVAKAVEAVKTQLQKPAVSLLVAHGIKQALDKNSTEQLEGTITQLGAGASPMQQLALQMMLYQMAPQLDSLRTATVDDLAAQVRTSAAKLDSSDIAEQLSYVLQNAPAMLPQKSVDVTGNLPAPQQVADIAQAMGKVASTTLGNAANGATFADTVSALKQFSADANAALTRVLGQTPPANDKGFITEKPAKKAPKKGKDGGKKNWKL